MAEAARFGDVESFGELYRRHYAGMVGVARSVLWDPHLAEDAAQEAFAVACRKLPGLRRPDRFAAWLRSICRNVARSIARSRARHSAAAEAVDAPAGAAGDESGEAASALVREAVSRLPASAREVVLLHYFSGAAHDRIAVMLDISPQAVNGRLTRARWKIAAYLRRKGLGSE